MRTSKFEDAIGAGNNVGAMELVALDIKRRGMYISRQLSFKAASYERDVIDLTPQQPRCTTTAAAFWAELHSCFADGAAHAEVEPERRNPNGTACARCRTPSRAVMTHYWGSHQRFFRSLCMAMKVPQVVEIAQARARRRTSAS